MWIQINLAIKHGYTYLWTLFTITGSALYFQLKWNLKNQYNVNPTLMFTAYKLKLLVAYKLYVWRT